MVLAAIALVRGKSPLPAGRRSAVNVAVASRPPLVHRFPMWVPRWSCSVEPKAEDNLLTSERNPHRVRLPVSESATGGGAPLLKMLTGVCAATDVGANPVSKASPATTRDA